MSKRIHVVVNPASGQPQPILKPLNDVFHPAGVDWDVSITLHSGDAYRQTQAAVSRGVDVVAAYGGDGTVMEVANGLLGSGVPLGILPGGTANLMSVELGIPRKLADAARLLVDEGTQAQGVDLGQIGDRTFLLRVGVGKEAKKVEAADRELKDRYGKLAYSIAALRSQRESEIAHYRLTLDGREVEAEGFTCLVDNAGNMGLRGLPLARAISVRDGFLDVILVRNLGFRAIYSVAASITDRMPDRETFHHWQAREITIEATPSQLVHADGEVIGRTPITLKVLPGALSVLTPLAQPEMSVSVPLVPDGRGADFETADLNQLVVIKYPNLETAERAWVLVRQLEKEDALRIRDAVILHKSDQGKLKLRQAEKATRGKGALRGGGIGLLLGAVAAAPAMPFVLAGAAVGAIWTAFKDPGAKERLMQTLGEELVAGEAALGALVESIERDIVRERLAPLGGELIQVPLTDEAVAAVHHLGDQDEVVTSVTQEMVEEVA
jgi:YegS/Rv2252/BmrU family lipid kinase